ncbi:hypothetical protein [Vulcanisaeta sp. JCM 14467]|uniref:hypothetical protein n=1 Tax=Vulcanisaeta sp. JCM 14467 TaxID=1295370 RepID=UPI0006D0F23F|nr:hypothetical protein [Vulcanisaeta sp. JCM 14467]
MGFRSGKPNLINGNEIEVRFYGSNAIDLARTMINALPPILRDILDALAFEKRERIKRIAEMELKFRRVRCRSLWLVTDSRWMFIKILLRWSIGLGMMRLRRSLRR